MTMSILTELLFLHGSL